MDIVILGSEMEVYLNLVGKKEILDLPILGWILKRLGHIGIDRKNKDKAIGSLDKAGREIEKHQKSLGISPEGTRRRKASTNDFSLNIQPFKKGPFHLAKQTSVQILPVLILGAHRLWPPNQIFTSPGHVILKYCPIITSQ